MPKSRIPAGQQSLFHSEDPGRRQGQAPQPAYRFVMLADVLGFRNLQNQHGLSWIADRSLEQTEGVQLAGHWEVQCEVFSDTLLVYGRPFEVTQEQKLATVQRWLDWREADLFFRWCTMLMKLSFQTGLPYRAGIAFGKTVIDPKLRLFLGDAIIQAYDTEQAQDWSGVALHPSAYEWLDGTPHDWLYGHAPDEAYWPVTKYNVPVKPGVKNAPLLEYSLNWANTDGGIIEVEEPVLRTAKANAGTPHEARWTRTTDFYQSMRNADMTQIHRMPWGDD